MLETSVLDNEQGVHTFDKIIGMLLSAQEKHLDTTLSKLQQNVTNTHRPLCEV